MRARGSGMSAGLSARSAGTTASRASCRAVDGSNEAVAAAGNIADVALAGLAIAKGAAQGRHVNPEIALFDEDVGPDPLQQLLLADDLALLLDESQQNVAGAAADADRLAGVEQAAAAPG